MWYLQRFVIVVVLEDAEPVDPEIPATKLGDEFHDVDNCLRERGCFKAVLFS